MGTYYEQDGFATNDIAGAVAAAALHDLHLNNFVFQGFPAVLVAEAGKTFEIRLAVGQSVAGPLVLSFQDGKRFGQAFRAKKQIGDEWMRKLQGLIVELERAEDGAAKVA